MDEPANREKRIVSFLIWDPELERKIDREVKIIDGVGKLLNVATSEEQTIECHKALILSQQRMLAFMSEIQRKQANLLQRDRFELEPTKATLILSDIRLPLAWTKMKVKSEQKTFAVFCLARIGCEIIDTNIKFIDKRASDILFTEKLVFDNAPHDFQLHLEVYALNTRLALSSSVKDFANRYSYFAMHGSPKTARRAVQANSSDARASEQPRSKFVLIARTMLTKRSVSKSPQTRSLQVERVYEDPLMRLPIGDSFLALFFAQPLCYTRLATFVGIVRIYNVRYSCNLAAGFLHGEEFLRHDCPDQHRFSIAITPDTIILSRDDRLSFSVYNRGFAVEDFFVQDIFTLNNWIRALRQHVVDIGAWQSTFEHLPSMRRYSHQVLTSSPRSSIAGRTIRSRPTLRTKAKSLNDIYQPDETPPTRPMTNTSKRRSLERPAEPITAKQSDEDDDVSVYRTRF